MARILFPGRDERAAMLFDDLASACDAGLLATELGADPALGDHAILDLLRRRGVAVDATEGRILTAAWRSGRIGAALRLRAERRRQRAANTRTVLAGLRYPIVLLTVGLAAAVISLAVTRNPWLPLAVVGAGALMVWLWLRIRRALATGEGLLGRLPFLRTLGRDYGELPYLEVLHGLYAAGVPLLSAHPQAVAACPHARLRAALQDADAILQNHRPLTDALRQADVLATETRSLLATGEHTGNLEDALQRALHRRSDVVARNSARLARWSGAAAYAVAAGIAVWLIFSIYSSTLGALYGHLRH